MQDYGAPVGYRLAVKHPERITAIVVQNGNAYDEGLDNGRVLSVNVGTMREFEYAGRPAKNVVSARGRR